MNSQIEFAQASVASNTPTPNARQTAALGGEAMTTYPPVDVYSLPGAWGLPSVSPFCLKLLTWLRMVDIPYNLHILRGPPTKPRTRKAPYVVRPDGSVLPDSNFIIETLKRERGITLDDGLSATESAMALLVERTLEKSTYFVGVYNRWGPKWKEIGADLFPGMPAALFHVVTPFVRRTILKQPKAQGVSRNAPEQIYAIGRADIEALAELLGEREYFFGEPTTIDATAYGFFANGMTPPLDDPLTAAISSHANIVAFCARMAERYWQS